MKIAFIGHNDFGKAALDAFLARGDPIAGVFCAPEKPGEKPDPVRLAAQALGLPLFQLKSLRNEAAVQAMRAGAFDFITNSRRYRLRLGQARAI